jgi:hypothetical protein
MASSGMCSEMISGESASTRAYFVFWGKQCDPDEVSRSTGVVASRTWRVGDVRNARTRTRHEDAGWRIDSDGASDLEPAVHVKLLVEKLWHARDYLRALAPGCDMQFSIVIHCRDAAPPPIHMSRESLHRVASLNAAIDVDLYCR